MENLLIIGFGSIERINKCNAYWSGAYLQDILYCSGEERIKQENIVGGIAYLTGRDNYNAQSVDLKINEVSYDGKSLKIKYSPIGENSFSAAKVKATINEIIHERYGNIMNIPFCVSVDKNEFTSNANDVELLTTIKKLTSKNKWREILELFADLDEIEKNTFIRNNLKILNSISFAAAKLSECYENLKRKFRNDEDRKKYLEEKKKLRKLTLKLRERSIELTPDKPGGYSSLGYSHYQYALELSLPGGRRDGNLKNEISLAIENFDKALSIDPNRINDLYRKGKIIADLRLPFLEISDKNNLEGDKSRYSKIKNDILLSKESFERVIDTYRNLHVINENADTRYFKEYIKSLYNIAALDIKQLIYRFRYISLMKDEYNYIFNANDKKLLIEASKYLKECCDKDNKNLKKYSVTYDLMTTAMEDGFIEGVFKLYSIGKIYSLLYQIYFTSGRKNEAEEYFHNAEKYLQKAISFRFPKEKSKQNKNFIKEKLARLYIFHGEAEKAIGLLEPIKNGHPDYYIRYTLAVAYYKTGKYEEAIQELKKSFEKPESNKDKATGEAMMKIIESKTSTQHPEKQQK